MLNGHALRILSFAICLGSIVTQTAAFASPPPPPPDFVDAMAQQLLRTPSADDLAPYAALLADDLKVIDNGTAIATSKAAWLAIQRHRLGKVDRRVQGYAEGSDNVLIFDSFDDLSDEHCPDGRTCVFDPRFHSRAVRYEIGADHLVHAIRIVESDGFLRSR
jgi:hypothetical protein